MNLDEKFEINRKFRNLRDHLEDLIIFNDKKDEVINELYLKAEDIWNRISYPLIQVENEYIFFNSLHKQTKYDNIISLIKICERLNNVERLDIDKSKIIINIANPNFNNAWDQINDMIEIPQDILDFIDEYDSLFKKKEIKKEKKEKYIIKRKNPDGSISSEDYNINREQPYVSLREYIINQEPQYDILNDEELYSSFLGEIYRNR